MAKELKYSSLHKGATIVHFVGGKMTEDLKKNLSKIAKWVLDNDITILWGDDYEQEFNAEHPVAALIEEVKKQAKLRGVTPNKPIRCLHMGRNFEDVQSVESASGKPDDLRTMKKNQRLMHEKETDSVYGANIYTQYEYRVAKNAVENSHLRPVVDEAGILIGYTDTAIKDQVVIYCHSQQDRQRAYYNNADGLFVLPGGPGCAYEITNAFIYAMSGDVPSYFSIYVLDNPEGTYKDYIEAYLKLTGNNPVCRKILTEHYSASVADFVKSEKRHTADAGVDE